MIAHDGLRMPSKIKLNAREQQQIHIYGSALLCRDGRTLTIFRHDLNSPQIERKPLQAERSL